jgi:hypothetical protein
MAKNLAEFRPIAYYDKHLDCIRVKLQDCRTVEVRLNRFLTVLSRYDDDGMVKHVGFTIKGIAHLFSQLGLKKAGILKIVDILNKMLEKYPDDALKSVYEEFTRTRSVAEINVDFRIAA